MTEPIERIDGAQFARWRDERSPKTPVDTTRLIAVGFVAILMSFTFLAFGAFVALFAGAWRNGRAPKALAGLSPDPPEGLVYPVQAKLMYREWTYGVDAGMVAFCDGWMHYEGFGFSCSLRSDDVLCSPGPDGAVLTVSRGRRMQITFYKQWDRGPEIDIQALRAALREWSGSPAPEGESVYPPLRFRSIREASRDAPPTAILAVAISLGVWTLALCATSTWAALTYGVAGGALWLVAIAILVATRWFVPKTLRPGRPSPHNPNP